MMSRPRPVLSLLLATALFGLTLADEDSEKIELVTYGSTIKLEHVASSHRLHSHDVSYGTGSGQQSVTGFPHERDSNSYWIVRPEHGEEQPPSGTPVECGSPIRLQHLNTGKNMHSHDHRAPMNRDNEVSAYAVGHEGRWAVGDIADNWLLECDKGGKVWKRFENIRLKHQERGNYLSASSSLKFGDPIPNQLQISASGRRNSNTVWKANEGFYIAPLKKKE